MRPIVRYTWFVLTFNVAVIVFGAFVRATGSGAGCGRSWPTCQPSSGDGPERAIELTHRLTAGVGLVLVVLLAVWVWRSTEQRSPARTGALLSVVAIVGEALIGAMIVLAEWVADDASVARAVSVPLHLVNTLFLLAALALTVFWLSGGSKLAPGKDPTIRRAVILGGVALVIIAASGAVTALADTLFPKEGSDTTNFLTALRVVHPILAIVAATLGWWFGGRSAHRRSLASRLLPWLVGAMLVSGVINIGLGVPVWMQLVHLLLADALWVSFVFAAANALEDSSVPATV